jgi:hypothetical protein
VSLVARFRSAPALSLTRTVTLLLPATLTVRDGKAPFSCVK